MKNVAVSVLSVALTILATASAAHATLSPFAAVAGINPATGAPGVKVVITAGATVQTLTSGAGLSCSGTTTAPTCFIQPSVTNGVTDTCTPPGGGTAVACRKVGNFDLFRLGTGPQIAVKAETNTDSVQVENLRIVNARGGGTSIKIEASGNIAASVDTTAKAHGMKLVGNFYRTITQVDGSKVSLTASLVLSPSLAASVATVSGSFVYVKNAGTCTTNPVPQNTTCQGGRTNYKSGTHTVSVGSLSNNSIRLGVPLLLLDGGIPSSTKCSDAFSAGTDCVDLDHSRVTASFILANPVSNISTNTTVKCSKAPCKTVDYVDLAASAAGYSGQTEWVILAGTPLVTEPQSSLNPDDQGFFSIEASPTEEGDPELLSLVRDTSTCYCFDILDKDGNVVIPGATYSPGKIDPETGEEVPAKAVSCTRHGLNTVFKFDTPDTGHVCGEPRQSYVLRAFCTVDVVMAEPETTSGKGNKIIETNVSGQLQGVVNGEGQIDISPCN